ncbi:MAG: hypothetical protein DMF13_02540 [Verrucomicrobia bacterium]|nr:MAG: hypothetical protein DMF13_02540 [Verrucomicrobiota bacterium]
MEAKIDNMIIVIARDLFVFIPKGGLEFPHSREEAQHSTAQARAHSVKKIKEARVKSEVTIEYCTV